MRLIAIVTFLAVAACGGGIDTPSPSSSREPSNEVPSDPSNPPSSATPPATSESAPGSENASPPAKVGEPPSPGSTGAPFHLVLSSLAPKHQPMQMDIEIDGTAVISGSLAGGTTYTFDFTLAPGAHKVGARAKHSIHETTETFDLDVAGELWGILKASAGRCDPCGPAAMTWEAKTTP